MEPRSSYFPLVSSFLLPSLPLIFFLFPFSLLPHLSFQNSSSNKLKLFQIKLFPTLKYSPKPKTNTSPSLSILQNPNPNPKSLLSLRNPNLNLLSKTKPLSKSKPKILSSYYSCNLMWLLLL